MRSKAILATAALILGAGHAVVLTPTTAASTATSAGGSTSPWCADRPAPCLEGLWRDGVAITSTDPTYSFSFIDDWEPPTGGFWWQFMKNGGYDMGSAELGHTFRARVYTDSVESRTAFGFAEGVDVDHVPNVGAGFRVDITVRPVSMIFSCTASGGGTTCPHAGDPEDTIQAMAYGTVDNGNWWGAPSIRDQVKGLELFTNVHVVSTPPQFSVASDGTTAMSVLLQNSHEYSDGTLFEGFAHYRVPHRLLREGFGIPDPGTMTGSSLVTTVSGTTATANFSQDGDAVTVGVDDITFSKRRLRVETGTITPTTPKDVRATRLTGRTARVAFDASRARGARVRGYTAQCQRPSGADREAVNVAESPARVRGLTPGLAYECRVRARSEVGPSRWSRWDIAAG